jgi:hypothetical protein
MTWLIVWQKLAEVFAQPSVKFRTAHVSVSTISIGCRNIITKKILANAQLSVAAGDGLKQQLCLLYRCIEVFDLKTLASAVCYNR